MPGKTKFRLALLLAMLALTVTGGLWLWGARLVGQSRVYDPLILEAARRYQLDPLLIRAVIWRESDFQPNVSGLAGERGLMQVRPVAGQEWAKAEKITTFRATDLRDPRTNILAGSWYLARAISRWNDTDQPEAFALAEYNAGRSNARRWAAPLPRQAAAAFIERIDFPTTKAYVRDILEKRDYYRTNPKPPTVWRAVRNEIAAHIWRWKQKLASSRAQTAALSS
ncbi:MAG: lytic transglycosylase domain-containing protein [Verrucomicrobiales bacterium]|nr:lytic transglycosylase domain-containing protein [Verrucomicrobiales bacterium]